MSNSPAHYWTYMVTLENFWRRLYKFLCLELWDHWTESHQISTRGTEMIVNYSAEIKIVIFQSVWKRQCDEWRWPQCAVKWDRNLKPKLSIMRQCTSVRQMDRQMDTGIIAQARDVYITSRAKNDVIQKKPRSTYTTSYKKSSLFIP